jgi:hypothetical protein
MLLCNTRRFATAAAKVGLAAVCTQQAIIQAGDRMPVQHMTMLCMVTKHTTALTVFS